MCLIGIALQAHPKFPLIIAANRDEFYQRETARADWWTANPDILGGRDLQAGGTWMAVHRDGRLGCVTNYRDLRDPLKEDAPSRGELIPRWLESDQSAERYLRQLDTEAEAYNGFNLLLGDAQGLWHYANPERKVNRLSPGIHGLSNHLLDTPWPKVLRLKQDLQQLVQQQEEVPQAYFSALLNRELAPDHQLPDTGIGLDWERNLSAMFIEMQEYGTRVSTLMMVDQLGKVYFEERSYVPQGEPCRFTWTLNPAHLPS